MRRRWTVADRARMSFMGGKTAKMLRREISERHHDVEVFEQSGGVNWFIVIAKAVLACVVLGAYSAEPILFYFAKTEGQESYAFSVASVFCISTLIIALGTWALDGFRFEFWTHFTLRDFCIF